MTESAPSQDITQYLSERQVLIADPNGSARSGISAAVHALGARGANITLASSYLRAEEVLMEGKPEIVIMEYDLGNRCGLELLQRHRERFPEESRKMIFIIVTGNSSQSAVARSAEEDVDAYIVKPFTPDTVKETIQLAAQMKINPTPYYRLIEDGKRHAESGDEEAARECFYRALEADAAPALACAYLGQLDFVAGKYLEAEAAYIRGLELNEIHYKCMVGLLETRLKLDYKLPAHEIMKRLVEHFPLNQARLMTALRLAVKCGRFEDIDRYYKTFVNFDERDEELVLHMGAALVVAGKFQLQTDLSRAMDLFHQATVTCPKRTNILREIITGLIDHGRVQEATRFMNRFAPEASSTRDYELCDLLVSYWDSQDPFPYDRAIALIRQGVEDERLYELTLRRTAGSKLVSSMGDLLEEACRKFPKHAERFRELADAGKAVKS